MDHRSDDIERDAPTSDGHEPRSKRDPLNRELIVRAAVALIDREGLAALTMRRVGQKLGVRGMALYRYVPGREDLLDAVVDHVWSETQAEDDVEGPPADGWRAFIRRLAHGVRAIALSHPNIFPLAASRPPEAPWLRPPLRTLNTAETFLLELKSAGFSDQAAVLAYRSFTSFLLGHLLLEVFGHDAESHPRAVSGDHERPLPTHAAVDLISVKLLREQVATRDQLSLEFDTALEDLLRRLELMRQSDDEFGTTHPAHPDPAPAD